MTNLQAGLALVMERTERALERPGVILGLPVPYDAERIASILKRWEEATPGPWLAEFGKYSGQNWMVAETGAREDGELCYITTDHLHASEMVSGGAEEDAEFMANAWGDVAYLVRLVEGMRLAMLKVDTK